jgi:hypothetical protein
MTPQHVHHRRRQIGDIRHRPRMVTAALEPDRFRRLATRVGRQLDRRREAAALIQRQLLLRRDRSRLLPSAAHLTLC